MAAIIATLVALLAPMLTNTEAALAHARVESTAPANGAVVPREPAAVSFTFDETVESSFGAVRVFDARSARVDTGSTFHPGDAGPVVAVRLRSGLPKGTYTATYRVISADGHPVSGGFVFSIGAAGAAGAETVSQLAGKAGAGPVTSTAFAVVRALQYGAIATAIGLLLFLVIVLRAPAALRPSVDDRARLVLLIAGMVGCVSAVLAVLLEGAVGGGTSLWSALDRTVIHETLQTRFGVVWLAAAIGWLVVAGFGSRVRRAPVRVIAAPLLLLALLPAFGGHAATQHPAAVYVLANVLHVLAISAWFGGLVALLAVLPVALRAAETGATSVEGDPVAGTARTVDHGGAGAALLATALPRFSRLALGAVALILATGTLQAVLELTAIDDLVDTAFGRAILVKVLLLAAAGAFATFNHRRIVPALAGAGGAAPAAAVAVATDGGPGVRPVAGALPAPPAAVGVRSLTRAVRAEVALVVAIFAASGALGGYPPPTQIPPGPLQVSAPIGPDRLTLTVDPARVGPNQIRIALQRGDAPATDSKQLTVTAVEADRGIGPLSLELSPAGPGTYVASAAMLPVSGHWRLTIVNRVSEFDEFQAFATVPIP